MEYIQENERTPKKDEGGINLRDVVELIIANWYWFVLSVLVCVGSAYFYVLTIQPVYQRQAVMLVKDKEKSASDMSAMLEVSGGITGTSVDNEIYILRSHQLLREVVNRLHLDVGYAKDGILRDAPLYAESPVEVHFIDLTISQCHSILLPSTRQSSVYPTGKWREKRAECRSRT